MDKCGCFAAGAKSNTKGLLYNTFFNNNYFILPSIFDPVSNQCVFNADTPSPAVDGEGYCLQCSSSGTKAMFSGNSSGTLKAGSKISLTNGMYLTQQTDGSLYLKSTTSTTVYFASNTGGQSFNIGFKSLMQTDGNFVVYNPSGSPIFNTVTGGQSTSYKYCMAIMPSGDMALYSSARCSSPIWQASKGVSLNKPCNGALSCSYSYLGNFVAY